MNKIPSPEFLRGNVEFTGYLVHVALEREDALGSAKSAKCTMGRMVGCYGRAANADIGTRIGTSGMNGAAR